MVACVDRLTPRRSLAIAVYILNSLCNFKVRTLQFHVKVPLRCLSGEEIDSRAGEAAEMLHVDHLLDRKTANLSGGEMQRVSIGRAIVRRPRMFLMDGPLSNLDAKLRESLRVELKHLQKTQGVTTLFVTHDQIEALTMADRLAVLSEERIIQVGIPEDIHDHPATTYVAQLVGTRRINWVEAARPNGRLRLRRGAVGFAAPSTFYLPKGCLTQHPPRGCRYPSRRGAQGRDHSHRTLRCGDDRPPEDGR